jgi:Flp pilus assembly protein TadB
VTPLVALSLLFAAVVAAGVAGLYLAWPRRMTAEEWVIHRREAALGRGSPRAGMMPTLLGSGTRWGWRLRRALGIVSADLRLLHLRGLSPTAAEAELATSLLRLGALGAGGGLAVGLALWALSGREGNFDIVVLMTVAFGVLPPAIKWQRIRREAGTARTAIQRRLPRLLTGTRVVLESGAATAQQALALAVSVYRDPAADVLREALLDQEVRRVELPDALDQAGRTYGVETLRRLADAYRVGTREGTKMADLLSEFALELRQSEHTDYRERMTRTPVLMAVPVLVFFVLPLLALVLLLVLWPLEGALSQL